MAASLHELYMELYEKATEDDLVSQQYYLSVVEDQRHIAVDYLLSIGALFIPNNEYIHHYLGDKVFHSSAGLYYQDKCPWQLFVVLPIRDLSGTIVGIVGWDAFNKYKEVVNGEVGLSSYRVSAKSVFTKERYFLTDIGCLERNFDSRVIFITDGVFDSVALNYRGIPAAALLGSTFSSEVLYFLSWYTHVYVCADNDKAGMVLASKLSKALPNVRKVTQSKTKDIEELLRGDGLDGPITQQLRSLVLSPVPFDVKLRI